MLTDVCPFLPCALKLQVWIGWVVFDCLQRSLQIAFSLTLELLCLKYLFCMCIS